MLVRRRRVLQAARAAESRSATTGAEPGQVDRALAVLAAGDERRVVRELLDVLGLARTGGSA